MIAINIKADLKPLQRAFIDLHAKQVPFATSLALNALARGVADAESALVDRTFDTPTPFTEKAYRIEVATKARPIAVVAMKDIQAAYLAPYVVGGQRSLGQKRGMLAPRAVGLNKFGNLTNGKVAALKGKPGVVIGPIKTKGGKIINGVWQRPASTKRPRSGRTNGAQPKRRLTLLIQFEDTTQVRKHLEFYGSARAYVQRHAAVEFTTALRRALATARR